MPAKVQRLRVSCRPWPSREFSQETFNSIGMFLGQGKVSLNLTGLFLSVAEHFQNERHHASDVAFPTAEHLDPRDNVLPLFA